MFKPVKRLQYWFRKYNKLYFDDKLPEAIVGYNDELIDGACAVGQRVTFTLDEDNAEHMAAFVHIDPTLHVGARDERLSLLHEMCHLALFPYEAHGKKFKDEKRRVAMLGALDDLW